MVAKKRKKRTRTLTKKSPVDQEVPPVAPKPQAQVEPVPVETDGGPQGIVIAEAPSGGILPAETLPQEVPSPDEAPKLPAAITGGSALVDPSWMDEDVRPYFPKGVKTMPQARLYHAVLLGISIGQKRASQGGGEAEKIAVQFSDYLSDMRGDLLRLVEETPNQESLVNVEAAVLALGDQFKLFAEWITARAASPAPPPPAVAGPEEAPQPPPAEDSLVQPGDFTGETIPPKAPSPGAEDSASAPGFTRKQAQELADFGRQYIEDQARARNRSVPPDQVSAVINQFLKEAAEAGALPSRPLDALANLLNERFFPLILAEDR